MITYLGETGVLQFDSVDSFGDLSAYVLSKWNSVTEDDFVLLYSLPGKDGCILSNEAEFESMCYLVGRNGLDCVDMTVKVSSNTAIVARSGVCNDIQLYENDCSSESTDNSVQSSSDICQSNNLLINAWKSLITDVGQGFQGGIVEFRDKLTKYCISNGYQFQFKRNTSSCVRAICIHNKSRNCKWKISVTLNSVNGFAYIRKYNRFHTCGDILIKLNDRRLTSDLVAGLIHDSLKENPQMNSIDIVGYMRIHYGLSISYKVALNALARASAKVFGDVSLSYDKLRPYFERIKYVDLHSTVDLEHDSDTGHFKRCFISFGAAFEAFEYCRPLIFLDGTFMTGKYKGHLLAATAKDGNNGMIKYNILYLFSLLQNTTFSLFHSL